MITNTNIETEIDLLKDPVIRVQAKKIYQDFLNEVLIYCKSDEISAHVCWTDDSALIIEFCALKRRVGICFEAIHSESGWYSVDLRPDHKKQESGHFDTFNAVQLGKDFA